jgi:hypothetical protein
VDSGGGDLAVVARAADTRNGNVVSVDLKSEVLEGVGVANSLSRVTFSKSQHTRVLISAAVVLNDTLTNLGNVKKAVKEIGSPVEVGGAVRNIVSEHAHSLEGTAELVGKVADYGLRGSVLAAPVSSPSFNIVSKRNDRGWR